MTIKQLSWQQTQPDLPHTTTLHKSSTATIEKTSNKGVMDLMTLQPRIAATLALLSPAKRRSFDPRFTLIKASESHLMLSLISDFMSQQLPENQTGFAYHINEHKIALTLAKSKQDNFAATDNCAFTLWAEMEQLFGCVRLPEEGSIKLQPGLVHQVNGGVLILGLRSLLSQPQMWWRLKQMVIQQTYEWFSLDDSHPLPSAIPSMPLDLRVILVGDTISMAELQDYDPEFYQTTHYTEFENDLLIKSPETVDHWMRYIRFIAAAKQLPLIDESALSRLIKSGVRHTEDQHYLPLSPDWLTTLLTDAAQFADESIDDNAIKSAVEQKLWREGYLPDRLRDEIFSGQVTINTKEQIVGQINGLSVIEYPGHPQTIGEPTRLSCLVHFGDGELVDIERKNELAGNIHSKGMMIMQAFIAGEFAITNQLPFTSSLVFEQSYSEVDGDSASLAGLCVLMSALSEQPIDQQIAVTGSVDQFGHVQAIGGINEKIEGFFAVCQHQGLTGEQGVIIPASNQRHLCLNDNVIEAIKNEQFSIWTVENVADALFLLTGIPYKGNHSISLYQLIQARIQQALHSDRRHSGWFGKWLK